MQPKWGEYEIIDDFGGHAKCMAEKMCMESQLEETAAFIDLNTLEERLAGKNSIIHEFIDKKTGWCRSRFIPVDYDENGRLLHVLFCIECIEEEKKRENRLIYLAQTDLMTGLYNRGSGERQISHLLQEKTGGLLCLIYSGTCTRTTRYHNEGICEKHQNGSRVSELAEEYALSEKSIQRILRCTAADGKNTD